MGDEPKPAPGPTLFQSILLAALHRRLEAVAQRVPPDDASAEAIGSSVEGAQDQPSVAS